MKSFTLLLIACALGACGSIDTAPTSDEKVANCQRLEAATGTNHLSRQSCRTADPAELNAAREAADTLQRDQIQRSILRPGQPGAM
jgi:hypothetical protein